MNRDNMNSHDIEAKAPEGWFSRFDIEVLVPEVQKLKKGDVYLEVGVHLGRSLWVAKEFAAPGVGIWGIDIEKDPKIPGTNFIQGNSHEVTWKRNIDLLFIDADHSYGGCKGDIDKYFPYMKDGGVILFHDCDETSPGVVQAVNEFADEQGLTVELFKTGEKNTSMAKVQV